MKHIWIMNHYAILPTSPGGTRHYDLAKALVKRGYKVSVFAAGFHYTLFKDLKIDQYNKNGYFLEDIDGIQWYWLKTTAYEQNNWKRIINMLSFYRRVLKLGKSLADQAPDIVIGSVVHPFTPLAGLKLAQKYNASFVFEIRDLWPQTMIDMGAWSAKSQISKYFWRIERKTVKHADAIIALSPLTEKYLQERYQFENCFYIPNGIDLEAFDARFVHAKESSESEETIQKLQGLKAEGKQVLMFTGTVNRSNNIDLILDTAERLKVENPNLIFAIVGAGQEKANYQKLVSDGSLDNVKMFDPVGKTHVPHLLNLADALLLIQGKVMWGSMNKLFDYLASGKPIVSAVSAGHNNPLSALNSPLEVNTLEAEHVASAVKCFLGMSAQEIEEIKLKSRQLVEQKYNLAVLADKMETMFNSLSGK